MSIFIELVEGYLGDWSMFLLKGPGPERPCLLMGGNHLIWVWFKIQPGDHRNWVPLVPFTRFLTDHLEDQPTQESLPRALLLAVPTANSPLLGPMRPNSGAGVYAFQRQGVSYRIVFQVVHLIV